MPTIQSVSYRDGNLNPQEVFVGRNGVVEIKQHSAQGEGDRWFYEIFLEDGSVRMVFEPITVDWI